MDRSVRPTSANVRPSHAISSDARRRPHRLRREARITDLDVVEPRLAVPLK